MTAGELEPPCFPVGLEAAELVAQLQQATMPQIGAQAWSVDSVRTILAAPGTFACLVSHGASLISRGTGPCGVAVGQCAADEFELFFLGVLPAERRSGLGRRLLAEQLARARQAGASRCYLEVAQGNRRARALYRQAGFRRVGLRLNYYRDSRGRRHDALLLCKVLCKI